MYANSFAGPFIFDDGAAIERNENLRQLWPLTRAAWAPGSPLEGRPVVASDPGSPSGRALTAAAARLVELVPPAQDETCTARIAVLMEQLEAAG